MSPSSRSGTPAPPTAVTMPQEPFDAVIAIGVLIKGSTMHFEYFSLLCELWKAFQRIPLRSFVKVSFSRILIMIVIDY